TDLAGATLDRMTLALAAQRAECEVVGAPVGVMDQVASLFGRSAHAVFLDCASLDVQLVPLDLDAAGLVLLVIDTGVRHDHATGGYRQRRQECEQAAAELGLPTLRAATMADVQRLDGVLQRRARHVVRENARVAQTAERLRSGGPGTIGDLLT